MEVTDGMTEYERRRLENIKRNDKMLAALKIQSTLSDLATVTAKRKSAETKSYKRSPEKKTKTETPVILRRSLRARGMPPDGVAASGINSDFDEEKSIKGIHKLDSSSTNRNSPGKHGPLAMRNAFRGDDGEGQKLTELMRRFSPKSSWSEDDRLETFKPVQVLVDPEALQLNLENIARLVPGRIMSLKFFPTLDMQMVVVGNKFGDISFWNINSEKQEDGIYLYHPHSAPVGGIAIDPFSISKVYSSCYDGFIRFMNVEKEIFDMVYSSEYCIYSLSLNPHDTKSLCYGEGNGGFSMLDVRAGKSMLTCDLHEDRINTIDFNLENENLMATSSTDGTARVWDLRHMNADKPTSLTSIHHRRAVHSAYFSPTGKILATTSIDDKVGVSTGANYENTSMIYHFNQTGRWISKFRGIWGWDDSSIFIGNMKRGADVISVAGRRTVATLQSDLISAIPCRFDAHPYNVGMLAGATSGGQVYIWTLMNERFFSVREARLPRLPG